MLCHLEHHFFRHGPFLFAKQAKHKYKENETPVEPIENRRQHKEKSINEDRLFILTHNALDQDDLHADTCHT